MSDDGLNEKNWIFSLKNIKINIKIVKKNSDIHLQKQVFHLEVCVKCVLSQLDTQTSLCLLIHYFCFCFKPFVALMSSAWNSLSCFCDSLSLSERFKWFKEKCTPLYFQYFHWRIFEVVNIVLFHAVWRCYIFILQCSLFVFHPVRCLVFYGCIMSPNENILDVFASFLPKFSIFSNFDVPTRT